MKNLLLFILMLPFISYAQTTPTVYEEIIQIEGADKNELYYRSKKALIDNFKHVKQGIHIDDKDDGLVVAKGTADLPSTVMPFKMTYTLEVAVKDGKYKYKIDNIVFVSYYRNEPFSHTPLEELHKLYAEKKKKATLARIKDIDTEVKKIIELVKSGMQKQATSNW